MENHRFLWQITKRSLFRTLEVKLSESYNISRVRSKIEMSPDGHLRRSSVHFEVMGISLWLSILFLAEKQLSITCMAFHWEDKVAECTKYKIRICMKFIEILVLKFIEIQYYLYSSLWIRKRVTDVRVQGATHDMIID